MFPTSPHSPHDGAAEASGSGAPCAAGSGARPPARRVDSRELMREASELIIVHGQREYRLRVTSNGKLILTA
jgi:hemin uptake protein HemP